MPASIVKNFSNKTGKSEEEVEKLWNQAKEIVKKDYPKVKETDDNFYQIVTGILKKMLGMTEDVAAPAMTTTTMGDYVHRKKLMMQKRFESKVKKNKKKPVTIYDPPIG